MSKQYVMEDEPPYIVLIGVPDKQGLEDVKEYLEKNHIEFSSFTDNDFDFKQAAVVTVPLGEQRDLLKHYPLWRELL